ncbi:MAG TPA: CHAT domain-containing protein, partial [Gemmataceae bacterium]|nr:CHAT domain-containing protein [Gemmataceae bacterium]
NDNPLLRLRELRVRLWLGELASLTFLLQACYRALQERGDAANLALLLCEEGRAWDAAGNLDRAEACWRGAESITRPLPPCPARTDALLQLARLDHLRGHLRAALDRFDAVLAAPPPAPQALEAQLRRLLVLLDLNQWAQARAEHSRALNGAAVGDLPEELRGLAGMIGTLLGDNRSLSDDAELLAHQAARRGEVEAARELYRQAFAETSAPVRRARLALALGMLALAGGDRAEADRWLALAEELGREIDLPEVLWRALQARGQLAAEIDGNDALARRCFEEAVLTAAGQPNGPRRRAGAGACRPHRADVLRHLLRAACRRGDAAAVFRYQELRHGRLLLRLWQEMPERPQRAPAAVTPEMAELDRQIKALEEEGAKVQAAPEEMQRRSEELLLQRDRLCDEFLRDRGRGDSASLPVIPDLPELERALPAGAVYVAPALLDDELFLLVVRPGRKGQVVRAAQSAAPLYEQLDGFRRCIAAQVERRRRGILLGKPERDELDGRLAEIGSGPLGEALGRVLGDAGNERLVWVPDGVLRGLPLHALRLAGGYLVERREVAFAISGALIVHQAKAKPARPRTGPVVVVTDSPEVRPTAAREGEGVAASFGHSRILQGAAATKEAVTALLGSAAAVHLACRVKVEARDPLAAGLELPSGEKWRLLDWQDEPADGLPLVTLSAGRPGEEPLPAGDEAFALATGLLGAGVRAVLAPLWPVFDSDTLPLMWTFYRQRMTGDLASALAEAQRLVARREGASPLSWAAFALFGAAAALPPPSGWRAWWAWWKQRRHARRFPLPESPAVYGGQPCLVR